MSWSRCYELVPLVKLGEVAKLINGDRGKNYPSKGSFVEKGIPFINAGCLSNEHTLIDEELNFITEEKFDSLRSGKIEKGDILFCLRGSLGKFALVDTNMKGAIASSLAIIRANEKVYIDYLKHYLGSLLCQREIQAYENGAAQPNLSATDLKSFQIPLPPLDEQKRIAAILDKADAIRQKRKQAIELANEFLRSVFLDMFGDPVTNPKGLSQAKLTEFADVITGFAFKSAEYVEDDKANVRLCRGANTLPGYFDWKDTAYWDSRKLSGIENYKINAGDVILAMDRPWISSGLKVCVFPDNERDTYLVQRVARMRPKNSLYTDYLYSSILSKAFERHCCPTETTVPHISPVELKNFSLLMPDEDLLKKYNDAVTTVRKSKSAMEAAWLESNHILDSLSQKAFSY